MLYLEVDRVDTQLESMKFAQGHQTSQKVVYVFNGIADCSHDNLAMLRHRSRPRAQVSPVREVDLGLRVDGQAHPSNRSKPHPLNALLLSPNVCCPTKNVPIVCFLFN
uniref:Uncharacterized protein n=1 Tax=Sinocyclocheilus anshuiensis TaxID=1608454 RepID=A0A671MUA8_9TELE